MAIPTAELQSLSNKSIIELYSITLVSALHGSTDVTRFHSGVGMNSNANIIWQGNTYTKFPVIAEGFEYVGRGTLPRPTLTVSNVLGTITALMATANATTPFNDGQQTTRLFRKALNSIFSSFFFPTHVKVPTDGKSFLVTCRFGARIFSRSKAETHSNCTTSLFSTIFLSIK